MKVCITSEGETLDDQVDVRFGRCLYFIIVEIEDNIPKILKVISNPNSDIGRGGAGISSAEIVGNEGVDVIITGNIGPRAFNVLKQLNIEIYQGKGKIRDVIQRFVKGELPKVESPTGPTLR